MNDKIQGWINLYKPINISSFNAIDRIKKKFNINKIGHAGTLDPKAEGILPVAIGKTTKLIPFIKNYNKKYIFSIKWGEQTSTDDTEGEIIKVSKFIPNDEDIIFKLKNFVGINNQIPPKASAVKVSGKRAYKLLRSGESFLLSSKKVLLKKVKLIKSYSNNISLFIIECGEGFYVRSFARDLALSLGTFGHIFCLNRTKVGLFNKKNAILLDDLLKIGQMQFEFNCIHTSLSMLDDILVYEIESKEDMFNLSLGKSIELNLNKLIKPPLDSVDKNLVFLSKNGNIVSFGKFYGNLFKPKKVLI